MRSPRWCCSTGWPRPARCSSRSLLGDLINSTVDDDITRSGVTSLALLILLVVLAQSLFTFLGQRTSTIFGQDLLSSAREYIIDVILRLPLGRVEGASTGDLVTRVTRDVGTMSRSVQFGVPMAIISVLTVGLSVVAMLLNSVLLAVPALLLIGSSMFQVRRYLQRAQKCYIAEGATYSRINTTLTETVEGSRTVEALGLSALRVQAGDDDIALSAQAERYGMTLRNLLFCGHRHRVQRPPRAHPASSAPTATARAGRRSGRSPPRCCTSRRSAARSTGWSARWTGSRSAPPRPAGCSASPQVPQDRVAGDRPPQRPRPGRRGPALRLPRGPRRAARHRPLAAHRRAAGDRRPVGLGQVDAGPAAVRHQRAAHRLGDASGGVELTELPLESLRTEVALVTQEHHVFVGSVRDNILLAREDSSDDAVWSALAAVGSADWVERLPGGLDTMIGSGQQALTPAQAQQIALARLIIADPHTLVLDEATSLIDPRTARTLEGSMNALLSGRTVVAIAHRLHTAHDADRIAVVIDGVVAELGSHDELVEQDGEYAALWRAWTS